MQPLSTIKRSALRAFLIASGLVCLACPAARAEEQATVRVNVDSGRSFEGKIDATTSDTSLVLRSGSDRAWIRRTIDWSRIRDGEYAGQGMSTDELRSLAHEIGTWPEVVLDPTTDSSQFAVAAVAKHEPLAALPPLISSVTFDAVLANWDGDVEADGLVVHLLPIDVNGFYAATRGTVEIELFAKQRRTFHHAPQSGGRAVDLISRWTCTVTPAEFGPNGAVLKFPFAAAHPEFSGELGSYGLVHVRFSVPGSGVFEDSQDGVRIRPFTPLRDTLQLTTGARFFPTERTGRGKGSYDDGQ